MAGLWHCFTYIGLLQSRTTSDFRVTFWVTFQSQCAKDCQRSPACTMKQRFRRYYCIKSSQREDIYILYIYCIIIYIYPNIYIYTLIINPNWGWFMIGVNPTLVNDTDTFHTTPHGESTAESSRKWNSHILVGGLMWFNGIFHGDYRGSINQKQGC